VKTINKEENGLLATTNLVLKRKVFMTIGIITSMLRGQLKSMHMIDASTALGIMLVPGAVESICSKIESSELLQENAIHHLLIDEEHLKHAPGVLRGEYKYQPEIIQHIKHAITYFSANVDSPEQFSKLVEYAFTIGLLARNSLSFNSFIETVISQASPNRFPISFI
jgi:hypothetical protein